MIYHVQVVEASKRAKFEEDLAGKIDAIQRDHMRAEVQPLLGGSNWYSVLLLAHQDA